MYPHLREGHPDGQEGSKCILSTRFQLAQTRSIS
uniref:Uncharacterized protein n=1 Tax=Rhizophora mucronata TaxID=61149 RepID=A0A2P2N6L7_RHIMU